MTYLTLVLSLELMPALPRGLASHSQRGGYLCPGQPGLASLTHGREFGHVAVGSDRLDALQGAQDLELPSFRAASRRACVPWTCQRPVCGYATAIPCHAVRLPLQTLPVNRPSSGVTSGGGNIRTMPLFGRPGLETSKGGVSKASPG